MKKLFILLMVLLPVSAVSALAQTRAKVSAHSTVLSWIAAVPAPATSTTAAQVITAYNVYKSSTSGGFTLGTSFATVAFGTNTYTDNAVTPGNTVYYVVTSVCPTTCTPTESVFSNQVIATTPANQAGAPPAPTGLTLGTVSSKQVIKNFTGVGYDLTGK
jgi:hypothetical protein